MIPIPSPSRLSASFFREAGRSCAHYVQNGGRLRDIKLDEIQPLNFPLQLTPPPLGGRVDFPKRSELEADLQALYQQWKEQPPHKTGYPLRFLVSFCLQMEKQSPGWMNWLRVWLQAQEFRFRESVNFHYQQYLTHPHIRKKSFAAYWEPHPDMDPEVLNAMLAERILQNVSALSLSRRAIVVESELLGQPVIIKRYAANPIKWKRRWEHSRARRAWTSAKIMQDIHMPAIHGLGWLEVYENGTLQESYFISRQLLEMETLRTWLRREFPHMNETEKCQFRHRLRAEILNLQQHGLMHIDLKLSNLLVKGKEVQDLVFYWIDLEDLRPGSFSLRNFIRNLYQLNGSLPREIPYSERKAFVAGFQHLYPFTQSPRLLRYIQRKTRKRHRDELRRLQGA